MRLPLPLRKEQGRLGRESTDVSRNRYVILSASFKIFNQRARGESS